MQTLPQINADSPAQRISLDGSEYSKHPARSITVGEHLARFSAAKKIARWRDLRIFLVWMILTLGGLATALAGDIYDAGDQFSTTENTESSTWSYRYRTGTIRDGVYPLLPTPSPTVFTWEPMTPVAWTYERDVPVIGLNYSGYDLSATHPGSIFWPKDSVFVHPGAQGLVVLSWLSPFTGVVDINFRFADADGGGDGIAWYVELNNAAQTLSNGSVPSGGSPAPLSLTNVTVNAGDRINFIVSPGPNDLYFDNAADSTIITATVVDKRGVFHAANAGPDQTVYEGAEVILDGTASSHPNGLPLTYQWTQIGISPQSPPVSLTGLNSPNPSFIAPHPIGSGARLTFQLRVEGGGLSSSDTINVTVRGSDPVFRRHPLSTWYLREHPADSDFESVAYGNGRFVAVGWQYIHDTESAVGLIRYSEGGSTWQTVTGGPTALLRSIAFGNGVFVVPGGDCIYRSADGIGWTTVSIPSGSSADSVTFLHNEFIVQSGVNRGRNILRSGTGEIWQSETLGIPLSDFDGYWRSDIRGEGTTWKLGYGGGLYVAVGGLCEIYSSTDLVTWTNRSAGILPLFWRDPHRRPTFWAVHYGNGLFVAAGGSEAVFTSPDGINWALRSKLGSGNAIWAGYTGLTFVDGNFLAISDFYGNIFRSTDGIAWLPSSDPDASGCTFLAITSGRGGAVAVGGGRVVQNGPGVVGFNPASITGGGPGFPLTVHGSSFVNGATVLWNGSPRPTTFVSDTTLVAQIAAADIPVTPDVTTAAVTVENPDEISALPKPFVITAPNVTGVESKFAGAGETVTVSRAPTATSETTAGIDAWLQNSGDPAPVTITTATYADNPAPTSAFDVAGNYLDLKVTAADPADVLQADFYYPTDVVETATTPTLKFYNGSAWVDVLGPNGNPPIKNTTDNLDGSLSGGRFEVVFSDTSTPKITELGGTFFGVALEPLIFNGFLAPIGGSDATGGSFESPVRTFKAGSTIPVKFKTSRAGIAVTSGQHHLRAVKYSSETNSAAPIDATPQEAATSGNQFVLKGGEWHFNLDTKATGLTTGIWKLIATLSDGSAHHVWIQIK